MVAVQRGLDRVSFDAGDVERFGALMPFMIQALDLRRRFFDADAALSRLEAALAPVTVGVMVFDATGVLQHANPAARAVLARRDTLSIDPEGRLHADDPMAERALRARFAEAGETGSSKLVPVPTRRGKGQATMVRISSSRGTTGRGPTDGFTVLISGSGQGATDAAYLFGAAFGLSPEAARVVAALVAGDDLATYAQRAAISVNTVRYHLKSAFAAIGTRRQIDLVRRAVALFA